MQSFHFSSMHVMVAMWDAYVWLLSNGTWTLLNHVTWLIFGWGNPPTHLCGPLSMLGEKKSIQANLP